MQISLSSKLALLAAGASASAENYLPTTHVRSLGLTAVGMAHEKATSGRRMQGQDGDDLLAAMGSFMCIGFEDPDLQAELGEEMNALGVSCTKFGCDDPNADVPNLIMDCSMAAKTCDEDPSGEEFCIENTDVKMSMGLNLVGKSTIESTQCTTYTSPQYMKDLGRGCWSVDMTMNFGQLMEDTMMGNMDIAEDATDEKVAATMMNYFKFDKCSGEFADGTTCSCGLCNQGMGFELTCNNDLVSEECTNFDLAVMDTLDLEGDGDSDVSAPNVSIMRMLPSDEKASRNEEKEVVGNKLDGVYIESDLESSASFQEKAVAIGLAVISASLAVLV